jgi:hypothetical protein
MEQTNSNSQGEPQSERRIDSSRWRADAEAANERARREEQRAFQEGRAQEARTRAEQAPEVQRVPEAEPAFPAERAVAGASTDPLWQRWWEIQSSFVDDPRSSLAEAHALVSGVVDRAVQQLQEQRSQLEQSWSNGREVSTDDLRRGLQGYREFLGRLLSRTNEGRV